MRMQSFAILAAAASLTPLILPAANNEPRKKFFTDDPLWSMPRPAAARSVTPRKLSEYYDFFENTLFKPGERAKSHGEYLPSQAINTVDEAPDSAWYTNRHATRRMSIDELKRGPGNEQPPAAGDWTVVAAKNEGITPGFRIRDAAGRLYLLKFDPLSNPEMASAADVIVSKFLYALGYNVPENYVVYFEASRLAIGTEATLKDSAGHKRVLTRRDVAEMLARTPRSRDGRYRALASRLIDGQPVGPFVYHGTRPDDPNDLVPHEHRRDLRGLRTLCAWLGHDDSKSLNTLDVLVQEGGIPVVKHHLIDFGASLGSASFAPNSPRDGHTYLFSWRDSAAQFFSFGLYAPRWQHAKFADIPAAGRFEYTTFDPRKWVPDYPNAAFANENPADRLWAARKIAAFTDDEIYAIVSTGEYTSQAAADWVSRCLIERRNKILRAFLTGTAALDGFEVREGRLEYRSLASLVPGDLNIEWSVFDNRTGEHRTMAVEGWTVPSASGAEYLCAQIEAAAGPKLLVYMSLRAGQPRVVGVERDFIAAKGN